MEIRKLLTGIIAFIMCFSFYAVSHAGSFRVLPIKILLDNKTKMETLRIRNESPDKVTIQVKAVNWSQDSEGKDQYEETKDIVYFPRIFTIEGNEERMVKVGYQKLPGAGEKTYRLFIEELPETKIGSDEPALKMILRMSVPVFLNTGGKDSKKGTIAKTNLSGGKLSVLINNSGSSYFFIKNINVNGKSTSGETVSLPEKHGWYLLKGVSRAYTFDVPGDKCSKLKELNITVETDGFELKDSLSVAPNMCQS